MPPKRSKARGRCSSRPPRTRPPRPDNDIPIANTDAGGVGADTVPTDGAGIPPRPAPVPATRTAPVTNNETLAHLNSSQRFIFGKVMQAIINYWYIPMFAEQLSELCSDKTWIDRLVDQPMADCTIAFCERCKTIALSSETGESYFKVHIDIAGTLQKLYGEFKASLSRTRTQSHSSTIDAIVACEVLKKTERSSLRIELTPVSSLTQTET